MVDKWRLEVNDRGVTSKTEEKMSEPRTVWYPYGEELEIGFQGMEIVGVRPRK